MAAAGLVGFGGAHQHLSSAADGALAAAGHGPADNANGLKFGDELSLGEKDRHDPERLCREILIKARDDDPHAAIRKLFRQIHGAFIQELSFIQRHHFDHWIQQVADLARVVDGNGVQFLLAVAGHGEHVVAVIHGRLEDLHFLARNKGPLDAPDQLLGFTAEHGSADDLDGASALVNIHLVICPWHLLD